MNRNILTIYVYNLQTISKMAVPTGDSTANEVARCLNSITMLNIRNIISEDVLNELMNDCFVTRPIGDDSDSRGDD